MGRRGAIRAFADATAIRGRSGFHKDISDHQLSDTTIVFNLTGGTKAMAIAAYRLAEALCVPFVYFQSEGQRSLLRYYRAVPEAERERSSQQRTAATARQVEQRPTPPVQSQPAVSSSAQETPPALPTPDALPPNTRITGQRAKQVERFTFKSRSIKGVRIVPNQKQISAPKGKELVLFVEDQTTGGGFGGVIVEIDDSNPKQLLVLMRATKKEA